MLRYLSISLSFRSGKIDEKKKKVEGIKIAALKTNFSLKVAKIGSVVWSTRKTKNIHIDITCEKRQNLLLIPFVGFLKKTKIPSPAINKDIRMNTILLAGIISFYKYFLNTSTACVPPTLWLFINAVSMLKYLAWCGT
ncbi:MAG: hypothetical protein BroJett041_17560 [Candidatus Jettenia caeni]|nr:MAG: hypothetical protein BroJett041_17560 [Candidatus Jettenia caeni]GJQ45555.1 MAG: hypothetical protein JETCAE04_13090 [Candidatus Jettenia caeni]